MLAVLGVCAGAFMLAGASDQGSEGKTYRIKFDNAFGLVKGGDFRVGGVNAGQTTGLRGREEAGRAAQGGRDRRGLEAGLRRLPQGRQLRGQAAVADRRVLRGLPARQVGRAAPGRRRRAGGADLLDDPHGHRQRHHAPPLPRALPADRDRARHRPRGAPGRPPGGAAARAPGPARDLEGAAHPRRPERGHQELHHGLGHRDQRAREEQARRRALGARGRRRRRDLGHAPQRAARELPALPRVPRRAAAHHGAPRRAGGRADTAAGRPPARRARPRHLLHARGTVLRGEPAGRALAR